ncbi:MAG: polysaccharide biosynthesis C-terminal domain-containing protein, partial [Ignavibacteria bacterium]|nr:polysaccharide biosynthesis C-terminal domain-containing protein [Ignavibacteria bacterium]
LDTLGTFVLFIAVFLNLGLDSASGFYYFKPKEETERGKILFTVFVLRLLTIIPALILSYFSSDISVLLFKTDEYTNVVLITCLLLPLNIITSEQELIYRFHRKPWKYNLLTIIRTLVNIGAGVTLVVNLKWGVVGAQLASLISSIVVVVFSFFFYTRNKYTYQFSFVWAKKLIRYGFPLVIGGIAVWVYQVSDRYFLLYYKNLTDIGYYSIGSTFSQPLGLINTAVQMSWGILFYEIYNNEGSEKAESKKAISGLVKYYIILASVIGLFISVFAYEIVSLVATPEYLPGIVVLPLLLFASIIAQLIEIIGIGITLSEKTIYFTYILIFSGLVNFGLNFIFVPLLSYYGAAITTIIAYVVNLFLTYKIAQKYFPADYDVLKLTILFSMFLIPATVIPLFEIEKIFLFPIYLKIAVFIGVLSFPFLFGFVNLNQIKALIERKK